MKGDTPNDGPVLGMDVLAIKKAGDIPGWFPYLYSAVKGGIMVTGCMTTTYSRGPRKGERKWLTKERRIKVFVPSAELRAWDAEHDREFKLQDKLLSGAVH
jgi:hypothetical protein